MSYCHTGTRFKGSVLFLWKIICYYYHLVDVITLSDWIEMHIRQSTPAQGHPPSCCSNKPWIQSIPSAESSLQWKHQSTGQGYIHPPQSQCYPRDLLVLREVSGLHRRHLHRFLTFHHSLTIGTRNFTLAKVKFELLPKRFVFHVPSFLSAVKMHKLLSQVVKISSRWNE